MSRKLGSKNKRQPYDGLGPGLEVVVSDVLEREVYRMEHDQREPACVSRGGVVRAHHSPDRDERCVFCNYLAPEVYV